MGEISAGFFGDFLISRSLVTQDDLKAALELQRTTKRGLRIGEILVEQGCLSADDLIISLQDYKVQIRLGEILVSNGDLRFMQLLEALDEQRRAGGQLGEILIRRGHCSLHHVTEALEIQRLMYADSE
jgi:hypothetical protein